jgi:type I restriction enzyme S subunit
MSATAAPAKPQSRGSSNWPYVRLGDHVLKIGSGLTPLGGKATYLAAGIPLIRSQNVLMNRFSFDGLAFISKEQDDQMMISRVRPGDVLLNITGASIGRVCVVPESIIPANVNQHVAVIRTDGSWVPEFVSYYLSTPAFQKRIFDGQAGATRQALTKSGIENFLIPLTPIAEQQRIAAELTAAMAVVDKARRAAKERLAAAEALPAAYLREFFEGPEASEWDSVPLPEICIVKCGQIDPREPEYGVLPHINGRISKAGLVGS